MTRRRLLERLIFPFAIHAFKRPYLIKQVQDIRTPGLVAVWVGDRANERAHMGVVVSLEQGVLHEFDAGEFGPGVLPAGGITELLLEDLYGS